MALRTLRLIPQLARAGFGAPRVPAVAWERFWSGVHRTGRGGDVVWDADDPADLAWCVEQAVAHFDGALPVVDAGCGNGRYTRALAGRFGCVVGVDVAPSAVERARAETAGAGGLSFRTLDLARPDAVAALAAELGPVDIYVRGVLNTYDAAGRRRFAEHLAVLAAGRGTVLLVETAFDGGPLAYLRHIGVDDTLPPVVRAMVRAGLPLPKHSRREDLGGTFDRATWRIADAGPVDVHAVSVNADRTPITIPGYFAVVHARATADGFRPGPAQT